MSKREKHDWAIIGLNETESHVFINGLEYRMPKNEAALIQSIMCVVDTMEQVKESIEDLEQSIRGEK